MTDPFRAPHLYDLKEEELAELEKITPNVNGGWSIEQQGDRDRLFLGRGQLHGLNLVGFVEPAYQWPTMKEVVLRILNEAPRMLATIRSQKQHIETLRKNHGNMCGQAATFRMAINRAIGPLKPSEGRDVVLDEERIAALDAITEKQADQRAAAKEAYQYLKDLGPGAESIRRSLKEAFGDL